VPRRGCLGLDLDTAGGKGSVLRLEATIPLLIYFYSIY